MNLFNEEAEFHAVTKYVETAVKLNCVQTEVAVTEIPLPQSQGFPLYKPWLAQKIAAALGEAQLCTQVPKRTCQIQVKSPGELLDKDTVPVVTVKHAVGYYM